MCYVTALRHSKLRAYWLMALVWGGRGVQGKSMYSAFPGICSISYLYFVDWRILWAELNGGENSLHWKANMLPLFSIMTLWMQHCVHRATLYSYRQLEASHLSEFFYITIPRLYAASSLLLYIHGLKGTLIKMQYILYFFVFGISMCHRYDKM